MWSYRKFRRDKCDESYWLILELDQLYLEFSTNKYIDL